MEVAAFAMVALSYSMLARRLATSPVTAPIVFLAAGVAAHLAGFGEGVPAEAALHAVAEVALVVLLFLDAAQIDVAQLYRRRVWPTRMLAIGLPLTVLFGWGAGLILLPDWSPALLLLVAAVLAPTDAALGQPVLTNTEVPDRARRALTVESGLNDGIALPIVLVTAAIAAPAFMAPPQGWALFTLAQVTLGPAVGLAMGLIGGWMLLQAQDRGLTSDIHEGIGALALAALSYLLAVEVGGNGFIAAFAAGIGFGLRVRGRCAFVYEFTEGEGQLLSWTAFFLVGLALVPEALAHLTWPMLGLILVSLVVVRPLAIWLSLAGTDASPPTRAFFGWFGPRGLATALFALIAADQVDHEAGETVLHLAANAVWLSALLHGVTAPAGARAYARAIARQGDCPETWPVDPAERAYARETPT